MCGIAGTINADFSYENLIKTMGHRGPDEQNGYLNNNVNFFHLRLSILDIKCGHQPMHFGEKYSFESINMRDLANKLKKEIL